MTDYYFATDSIGPGPRFSFPLPGDTLTILPGVTVASTTSTPPLGGTDAGFIAITVLGTLAGTTALSGARPQFLIGPTGSVVAGPNSSAHAVTFEPSAVNGVFVNTGFLSSLGTIGLLSLGAGFSGSNSGRIVAAVPVYFGEWVAGTGSGATFRNSGVIEAVSSIPAPVFGSGIVVSVTMARVENLSSGRIVGDGPTGAGVLFSVTLGGATSVTGSTFVNAGEVTSLRWWGVDYGEAPAGTLTLINSGVIRGGAGAFRGHAGVDLVTNTGRMEGNVDLGDGHDRFVASGGTVAGDVVLGLGNDLYDGRGASIVSGTVLGGGGDDKLTGGAADDRLSGGNQSDSLRGGAGDDTLAGDAGNDTIRGGRDDDEITGGSGTDVMTGGSGRDVFIFASVADIGLAPATRDRITDFRPGEDLIDLSAIDANTTAAGNQAFTFITGAFTGVAGQLRYGAASGLLQGDVNGDGTADFALELPRGLALTAADIVL